MPTLDSYDAIPYEGIPITETYVEQLAAIGRLFGLATADPRACRVLELGCAEGGNLIPMAFYLPDCRFVGLDLSVRQIEAGQRLIDALGLPNVTLLHRDVAAGAEDLGQFDYVIAHGLFSWVPADTRAALLALVRRCLAPHGLAYVSWNALPGWHTRAMMRAMLLQYTRTEQAPRARLQAAHDFLARFGPALVEESGELAPLLKAEVEYLRRAPPSYVYHEYLAEVNEPMLFADFVQLVHAHGLEYVADAELYTLLPHTLGEAGQDVVADLDDRLARIQAMDFLRARRFHRSLLTHVEAPVQAAPDLEALRGLAFHADLSSEEEIDLAEASPQVFATASGARYSVRHPLAKAALMLLATAYPDSLAYPELYTAAAALVAEYGTAEAAQEEPALARALLDLIAYNVVRPAVNARRFDASPGDRPCAHGLARAQLALGQDCLASVRHTAVQLDAEGRRLLALCDGTRDLAALTAAMEPLLPQEYTAAAREACARMLWTFARHGLLSPAGQTSRG
ncbi:MAG: methyltransferase regulatory domain-containing protein [Burkholderiales bacterium]|nr:methyltransferase regulatory domain-containing protein [Burkholderiales bacterium]